MKFLNEFSNFAADILKAWHVPGAAIMVVQGGKVILAEGYGYRDVGLSLPVSPETVFPIGSATKAFSAMALGILVDEGKLAWDQIIRFFTIIPIASPVCQ